MAEGKWIVGLGPNTPVAEAARYVLEVRLAAVRTHLAAALQEPEKDLEHIHQLRVSTRRAGAALRVFRSCLPTKAHQQARRRLRRLRRAAGDARDWDVFLIGIQEHRRPGHSTAAGEDFLIAYALGRRAAAQCLLSEAAPNPGEGFLENLAEAVHPPNEGGPAETLVDLARPQLLTLVGALTGAAGLDLTDAVLLHRLRIMAKRLRYAMEIFVDCFPPVFRNQAYPAVEKIQDMLGRANDSQVALRRLAELRCQVQNTRLADWKRICPEVQRLLRFHQRRIPRERSRFLKAWKEWHTSGTGDEFLALLQG
jgi:CHAD domain-containing protein